MKWHVIVSVLFKGFRWKIKMKLLNARITHLSRIYVTIIIYARLIGLSFIDFLSEYYFRFYFYNNRLNSVFSSDCKTSILAWQKCFKLIDRSIERAGRGSFTFKVSDVKETTLHFTCSTLNNHIIITMNTPFSIGGYYYYYYIYERDNLTILSGKKYSYDNNFFFAINTITSIIEIKKFNSK